MRWTPLAVALFVQAILLLWRLDRLPVWGDEQFTLDVIALPWAEIAETLRRDIHPPLYFALAKLWSALPLPGSEIVRLRLFSALTMLVGTVALDRLVLDGRDERVRRWTLAVWTLLPAVTLYGRMGRSYALQTLLAAVALYFSKRLLETRTWRDALWTGLSLAALLYTHYLPGLAVAGALAAAALIQRERRAAGALALAGAAYLPWAVVLLEGLLRAADKSAYALTGSWLAEAPIKTGYAFAGLFFGEAYVEATFALSVAAGLGVAFALLRGWLRAERPMQWLVGVAAAIGFLGAAKWVSFPFMPARLLWLLPWLTTFAVMGAGGGRPWRAGLVLWGALLAAGQTLSFQATGFFNKGYLIPFEAIADEMPDGLVLADATNCDPSPLRARIPRERYLTIADAADVEAALAAASENKRVWHVRASRDVTPDLIQNELDRRLEQGGWRPSTQRLLPYSKLDRFLLRAAGDPDPATHHLLVLEFQRDGGLRETR